jgi:hypothetical protein
VNGGRIDSRLKELHDLLLYFIALLAATGHIEKRMEAGRDIVLVVPPL